MVVAILRDLIALEQYRELYSNNIKTIHLSGFECREHTDNCILCLRSFTEIMFLENICVL